MFMLRASAAATALGFLAGSAVAGFGGFSWQENFDAVPLGPYSDPLWTPLPGTLPAGVVVTDATSVSAPNSLLFDPALIGPGTPNYGSLEAGIVFNPSVPHAPTTWLIEFDVRRDAASDDSLFELVAYDGTGSRRALIALGDYGVGPAVTNISFGSAFAQANLPYAWGDWIHVQWAIEFNGDGTGSQQVLVDDFPMSFIPISTFNAPITSFGFVFRDPAGQYSGKAYVDNLSFTAIPAPGAIGLMALCGLSAGRRRRVGSTA